MNENKDIKEVADASEIMVPEDTSADAGSTDEAVNETDGGTTETSGKDAELLAIIKKQSEQMEAQTKEIAELRKMLSDHFTESQEIDNRTDFEKYLDSAVSRTYQILKAYGKLPKEEEK